MVIFPIILCSLFWSMGGNTLSEWLNKKFGWKLHFSSLWRKTGVPVVIGLYTWLIDISWFSFLQGLAIFGVLFGTIALSGYGVDSHIYKFIRNFTTSDGFVTNFITRAINGFMWTVVSFLLLGNIFATLTYIIAGSLILGLIGAGVRVAVVNELLVGLIVGLMALLKRKKNGR